jgi:outer membrane protein assembly factor BamB
MVFEGIPGGPLDCWADVKTPEQHLDRSLSFLRHYVPWEFERCRDVELTDPNGTLAWRFAPTVRKPFFRLPSGRTVFGMADAVVVNDPITGQGSNNAAKCANAYFDAIVARDKLFMSSGLGTGAALFQIQPDKLVQIWSHKEMQNWLSTSILWQGHIYGVDTKDGALKCLDFQSGAVKWAHEGLGVGSVTLAGGRLSALSDKGRLMVANASPTGYTDLAAAQILEGKCWTAPVLANGRIYARNAEGELVCIDVSGAGR